MKLLTNMVNTFLLSLLVSVVITEVNCKSLTPATYANDTVAFQQGSLHGSFPQRDIFARQNCGGGYCRKLLCASETQLDVDK